MTTVDQIKSAIERLSLEERAELAKWLQGWSDDAWDRQMTDDAQAGRLESFIDEVRRDIRDGYVEDVS